MILGKTIFICFVLGASLPYSMQPFQNVLAADNFVTCTVPMMICRLVCIDFPQDPFGLAVYYAATSFARGWGFLSAIMNSWVPRLFRQNNKALNRYH